MRYENIKNQTAKNFKRLTGVPRPIFNQMVTVLKQEMSHLGRRPKLSREDQLLMTLMYWREYRTQFHIGQTYDLSESAICRTIPKIENTLIQSGRFTLPGKKKLQEDETSIEVVLVDATEQAIERPRKKQKSHYSGKKKCHTQKAQVMVNQTTLEIIATAFAKGRKHDFKLFKESYGGMHKEIVCLADSGYQGLTKMHQNSETPVKKSKKRSLTKVQKESNRALSKKRIVCEHVIGKLKIFRILKERYHNRRKRFGLRFNLIASLYNLSLSLS